VPVKKVDEGNPDRPTSLDPGTFEEQRELDELPQRIEQLETEQQTAQDILSDPSFYPKKGDEIARVKERLEQVGRELETAFERWRQLEEKSPVR